MITVDYPPGAVGPSIGTMQTPSSTCWKGRSSRVRGGKEVTLAPGQTFYEGPNDVHKVGRNASMTKPAKFMVIM